LFAGWEEYKLYQKIQKGNFENKALMKDVCEQFQNIAKER